MEKLQLQERSHCAQRDEYSVYVFHFSDGNEKSDVDWEKKESTDSLDHALMRAKILHESGKYKKVEVKKKFVLSDGQRKVCRTLKTYQKDNDSLFSVIKSFIRPDTNG